MMNKITIKDVAEALGKSEGTIRLFLQRGLLPFGTATKMPHSNKYVYIIYPKKFKEYVCDI